MFRGAVIVGSVLVSLGCEHSGRGGDRALPQDAYVWQRRWDEAVVRALGESAPRVRAWRVLAVEVDGRGQAIEVSVNREALRKADKPLIAVVRVSGSGNLAIAGDRVVAIANSWKGERLPVSGIELDYDCGTEWLAKYRDYLHNLRHPGLRLSITALPSWLESQDLEGLLNEVDESILQVHSVMNAKKGLFDRATAEGWVREWAERSPKPFRVAVPTYWSRVSWDENGHVSAIESETTRYGSDRVSQEIFVDPREVSGFVRKLRGGAGFDRLVGLAWFRLPTSEDQRAWSSQTWHAVMDGLDLPVERPLVRIKADRSGARDVYVVNPQEADGPMPVQVSVVGQGCELADALPPYVMEHEAEGVRFRLKSNDVLRGGGEKLIGWVRCDGGNLEGHVSF